MRMQMMAALVGIGFSLSALAYPGQPKSIECTIYDGHVLNFEFNDIPASKIKLDYENPKGECWVNGANHIPLENGPFSEFRIDRAGCKKGKNGRLEVVPTFLIGYFWMPKDKDKMTLSVGLRWDAKVRTHLEIQNSDKDDVTLESIIPQDEHCLVTAFH